MLAAIAAAVPLPNLSLISFATASQTSALREEITTLAPCSAMRSAMARPMPRVEPVMTATFPVMSNRVMFLSRCFFISDLSSFRGDAKHQTRNDGDSSKLVLGGDDLRPGRLMHRGVPWI